MNELINKASLAKKSQRVLACVGEGEKNEALLKIADELERNCDRIICANEKDIEKARACGTSESLIDRLALSEGRISGIAQGVRQVASLCDPVGEVTEAFTRPNGLKIEKVRVPLGVIGMIYEARPNVTVDSAALALKSGNAIVLRGSSSALSSNTVLAEIMREALAETAVPADCVQLITEGGHETVTEMMRLRGYIDVLIPRGSGRLISSVVENASIPVIETGVGNCHVFIDESAEFAMARDILINAKTQRPSVCNACESVLVHRNFPYVRELFDSLRDMGVTVHATEELCGLLPYAQRAEDEDFAREYLSLDIAASQVCSLDEALSHIEKYSSGHTEVIVTENRDNAERFLREVDAASVNHNASSRFTDGFEFGFGAEIGISTQKLHARGPLGLRELCSYKYTVRGSGQIRG